MREDGGGACDGRPAAARVTVKATGRRAPATDSLPDPYAPRPNRQRRPNPKVHGPEWV